MMKRLLIAVLSTAVVLTAPAVAYAVTDAQPSASRATALPAFKKMGGVETRGVKWTGGYRFLPAGKKTKGAFNFRGTLRSFDKNNGAKMEVRVEGYSGRTYRAARGESKYYDKLVLDGAAQRTNYAWVKVCRDRGTLVPDNCSKEMSYRR